MSERKTYDVTASKDGRWWLVQVPELDTVGQARNAAEIEEVAREVIGLWLDVEPDTFDVDVSIEIPGDARDAWEKSKAGEAVARAINANAAALARRAVESLRADGLTFKDAGIVLGLSPQRVQQLAASAPTHVEELLSKHVDAAAAQAAADAASAVDTARAALGKMPADFRAFSDTLVTIIDAKFGGEWRHWSNEASDWRNVIEDADESHVTSKGGRRRAGV